MFSFGFKKDFKNKKGSIGLRFVEPFKKYKSFETELEATIFIFIAIEIRYLGLLVLALNILWRVKI